MKLLFCLNSGYNGTVAQENRFFVVVVVVVCLFVLPSERRELVWLGFEETSKAA